MNVADAMAPFESRLVWERLDLRRLAAQPDGRARVRVLIRAVLERLSIRVAETEDGLTGTAGGTPRGDMPVLGACLDGCDADAQAAIVLMTLRVLAEEGWMGPLGVCFYTGGRRGGILEPQPFEAPPGEDGEALTEAAAVYLAKAVGALEAVRRGSNTIQSKENHA